MVDQNIFYSLVSYLKSHNSALNDLKDEIYRWHFLCSSCLTKRPVYESLDDNYEPTIKYPSCRRKAPCEKSPFAIYSLITIEGDSDIFIPFRREQDINLEAFALLNVPYRTCVVLLNSKLISIQGGTAKSSKVRKSFENSILDLIRDTDGYQYRSKGMKESSTRYICSQHAEPKSLIPSSSNEHERKRKRETNRMIVCRGAIITRYDLNRATTFTTKHDKSHELFTSLVPLDTKTKQVIRERIHQGFLPFQIKEKLKETTAIPITYSQMYYQWNLQMVREYKRDTDPLLSAKIYVDSSQTLTELFYEHHPFQMAITSSFAGKICDTFNISEVFIDSTFKTNAQT